MAVLLKLALDRKFNVIVHGCNCQCTMGAGIAKSIKATFPEAFAADAATKKGDRTKLGTISFATVTREGHEITIVNGYTQFDWRGPGIKADYDAIRSVMSKLKQSFGNQKVGYPRIGAGLANGDWDTIAAIIENQLIIELKSVEKQLGIHEAQLLTYMKLAEIRPDC